MLYSNYKPDRMEAHERILYLFHNLIAKHGGFKDMNMLYIVYSRKTRHFCSVCHNGKIPDFILFTEGHIPTYYSDAIEWLRSKGTKIGF